MSDGDDIVDILEVTEDVDAAMGHPAESALNPAAAVIAGEKRKKKAAGSRKAMGPAQDPAQRAAARAAAATAKAAAKASFEAAADEATAVIRASRGAFARQEIAVSFEQRLASSELGRDLAASLAAAEYAILPPSTSPIGNALFWRRRSVDAASVANKRRRAGAGSVVGNIKAAREPSRATSAASTGGAAGATAAIASAAPTLRFVDSEGALEPYVCVIWPGADYVRVLLERGTDLVEAYVSAARAVLPPGTRLFFLVEGSAAALAGALTAAAAARSAGRAPSPVLSPDAYMAANVHLYSTAELDVKETTTRAESRDFLVTFTRTLAEAPYRMHLSALAVVGKVKVARPLGDAAGDGTGGASGSSAAPRRKTARETWLAQLQMLPGISAEKAAAIAAAYPTMLALYDAYCDPRLSEIEKLLLLEDCGGARKMTKHSQDLYRIFTAVEPGELIGGTAGAPLAKVSKKQAEAAAAGRATAAARATGSFIATTAASAAITSSDAGIDEHIDLLS